MIFDDLESTMRSLYKYCLSLTKSSWQAEDLVQETLMKVYMVRNSEPERVLTNSFLYTTAKNLLIDEKRRSRDTLLFEEDFFWEDGRVHGIRQLNRNLILCSAFAASDANNAERCVWLYYERAVNHAKNK